MNREIKTTNDGSKTLYIEALNESYHSTHGALQEAEHVFIKNGIEKIKKTEINILELGFGSGLNALVTIAYLLEHPEIEKVHYFTLEKYPIAMAEVVALDFGNLFSQPMFSDFNEVIHQLPWESPQPVIPNFILSKFNVDFYDLAQLPLPSIDLVYFDCFGARVQPDLWEYPLAEMVVNKMGANALLTTYSSKGSFQRVLKSLGLRVEKLAGPKGKREMINAWKS